MRDVVVVGAGLIGALVTRALAEAGTDVLLLEAGPHLPPGVLPRATSLEDAPVRVVSRLGFDLTRGSSVGGRGRVWGGWLTRPSKRELDGLGLAIPHRRLESYLDEAEARLGGVTGPRPGPEYSRAMLRAGFRMRPRVRATGRHAEVWQVEDFRVAGKLVSDHRVTELIPRAGRTIEVLARGPDKAMTSLRTRNVVLAASPIETARILYRTLRNSGAWRVPFCDGMVGSYALVVRTRETREPAAFVLEAQSPQLGSTCTTFEVVGPCPLDSLGIERTVSQPDEHHAYAIHGMGSVGQDPRRSIEYTECGRAGCEPVEATLRWAWSDTERRAARQLERDCRAIASHLCPDAVRFIRFRRPLAPGNGREAATAAMGSDPTRLCDCYGRLLDAPGIWIADGSLLPHALSVHPTLMTAALSLRVVERLLR